MNKYFIGINWFIASIIVSSINDIITKYLGSNMNLHFYQITFFRFAFGAISLIPFILYYGNDKLKTSRPIVHILRGLLLFVGMTSWTYGLSISPVTTATIISFMIPVFVLIFGVFFLKENIIWQRWVATLIAFIGLIFIINPNLMSFTRIFTGINKFNTNINIGVLILIAATICFALLDIINKIFVIKESMISMLFYSAFITSIFAFPFAYYNWINTPSIENIILLMILGFGANLILFLLLKAFALVDATALSPYRYLELIISATLGYLILNDIPSQNAIYGSFIIIPTTLFIIYSEKKKPKGKN